MIRSLSCYFLLLIILGCKRESELGFRELDPVATGITFANQLDETPQLNILTYLYYYNGAGVLAADFNNDSQPDLFFAGNQQENVLYLNQGGMKFKDISSKAGIADNNGWTTGVTHADINGDGLLDIYICKASGYRALKGRNLLYINTGIDDGGIPRFDEQAEEYGLDFSGLSTQAAFFDYDLDGDLDLFLLNHSVHPNRTYGKGSQRESSVDSISGDRLYRNEGGYFSEVSQEAGIFQGKAGYGLGLGISDLNNDGYPDIYVGNDFFENDYLYLNQKNGTFKELISDGDYRVGHTTHFSMGNDLADINNDGLVDILSLDMLPEDLLTYKTSGLEYPYPIYQQYLKNGFAPQYMQNSLQVNLGEGRFSEVAFLSGIAASEWSWGGMLADFDNDGYRDLFVTNGIKGATNDMDYMNFIANEDIQRRIDSGMQQADMPLTQEIPAKKVPNYIFRNNGDLSFTDMTDLWIGNQPTYSNGSTYADLDRDGDLDLVVNHVDQTASILENTLETGNSLAINLKGSAPNTYGIGARVEAYINGSIQVMENYATRGYLSAVPSEMHVGLGEATVPDSLLVIWPGGAWQKLTSSQIDSPLVLRQQDAEGNYYEHITRGPGPWQVTDTLIPFRHRENASLDFDREPLIPYARSNEGPDISIGDINGDGLEDLFISGAKRQPSSLYVQKSDGSFSETDTSVFAEDALSEDTGHIFLDVDQDGWMDLLVVSGGNEFTSGRAVQPRLYRNLHGRFEKDTLAFKDFNVNASSVDTLDLDRDGDLDIFISANTEAGSFGKSPQHGLFENDGTGRFKEVTEARIPEIQEFGSITDFQWTELNEDGIPDLIVAGHWTPISIFLSQGNQWIRSNEKSLQQTNGLWNCLEVIDIDKDGDMDLIGGNWGLNSKFSASSQNPLTLYRHDFDQNGSVEPLVTYFHLGVETPFASRDELGKQMPFINKKFRTYREFAEAGLEDIFGADALRKADRKHVFELASCIFINKGNGQFQKIPLPTMAQSSVVYDILPEDFNADGFDDLLITGNLFEISTQLGRLDAFQGLVLLNDGKGSFYWGKSQVPALPGAGRTLDTLQIQGKKHYIMGRNNNTPLFISKR